MLVLLVNEHTGHNIVSCVFIPYIVFVIGLQDTIKLLQNTQYNGHVFQ